MDHPDHDVFAEIAAHRPAEQSGLIEPRPPARPRRLLPMQRPPPPAAKFRPRRPLATGDDVAGELRRLRERMEPFLEDHAPALEQTRVAEPLERFQWRRETEADRVDFAAALGGGGEWEPVRIPHYGAPLGRAVTYYRTGFSPTPEMRARERLFVCFRGVDYKAHVFVNGSFVGSHEGFFAPFEFDITAHVRDGENILLVKVENDAICMGNGSWGADGRELEGDKIYAATGPGYDDPEIGWHHCPPGMGIYQDVRIEARSNIFIHDLFVRPLPGENRADASHRSQAKAEAWIELWNGGLRRLPARLTLAVHGQNFHAVACPEREVALPGPPGPRVNYYRFAIEMPDHRAWELDAPWLYQLQVRLLNEDGALLDARACQFGMRSFRMDTERDPKGRLFFNGREIRLRGANTMGFEQQDVMRRDWHRLIDDILLAKVCNMNFWRLTQRPVQAEVYDYCDRLGLLTQTDLPLFGKMRRSQFAEGIRQAGEMERLVRGHACNIMVTYINEPYPASWGLELWRHLEHGEMERFFLACDQAVRLENPDRVIKPVDGDYDPPSPGLPDRHCYCGWYNGHGLDIGKLHRGYWQRVKPGWMFGCGEFGAEGLEDAALMRQAYPESWLPQAPEEEADWSPDGIVRAQTGNFHYLWFDTQHSLADWVAASQAHQAWATRIMTEAFRRERRMNTFAIHLFIDAFPSGWMKAIMDCERRPKPAFFAYRDALTPMMVNLRADRFAFFGGETAEIEAWVCNDTHRSPPNARLAWRLEVDGNPVGGGTAPADIPACSSACQGLLHFEMPDVDFRTTAVVRLALLAADVSRRSDAEAEGGVLHDCTLEIKLFPRPAAPTARAPLAVLGAPDGSAARLARDLGREPRAWQPGRGNAKTILVDDLAAAVAHEPSLRTAVRAGACAVVLGVPVGEQAFLGGTVTAKACGMGPVQFVSRATGHPLVAGFAPDDFKFWYDAAIGHAAPLLDTLFTADGWIPILTSGNGVWGGSWAPALAAAETRDGNGRWRLCNLKLAGRIHGNPAADVFARRLINEPRPGSV